MTSISSTPTLHHIFGMHSNPYNNQYMASIQDTTNASPPSDHSNNTNNVLVTIAGKCLLLQNIQTQERTYTYLEDPIGCILFHTHTINRYTNKHIIYAGTVSDCNAPKIHVLEYSSTNMSLSKLQHKHHTPTTSRDVLFTGGAECGYACLGINSSGTLLASVSTHPDYWLCLWDISSLFVTLNDGSTSKNGNIILLQKVKASSQDIYNVYFIPSLNPSTKQQKPDHENGDDNGSDNNGIITCGSGHITFWSCTKTFTGTKLIGSTGKFGKVDLMDIHSCCALPSTLVASATMSSSSSSSIPSYLVTASNCSDTLLLWEGYYVKCRIVSSTKENCALHDNGVYAMELLSHNSTTTGGVGQHYSYLLTGGGDGTVKWWSCHSFIEAADQMNAGVVNSSNVVDVDVSIQPIKMLQVGSSVPIQTLFSISHNDSLMSHASTKHEMLVHDRNGVLWFVSTTSDPQDTNHDRIVDRIWDFHAGTITAMDTSPNTDHLVVTVDDNGCICCWDYAYKIPLCRTKYTNESCSAVKWASTASSSNNVHHLIVIGFTNGILRFFSILPNTNENRNDEDGLQQEMQIRMVQSLKPHEKAVSCISFSSSGKYLATSSLDGTIFFFLCPQNYNDIDYLASSSSTSSSSTTTNIFSSASSSGKDKAIFIPIGFIHCHLNNPVSFVSWCRPTTDHTILYTTVDGEVVEVDLSSSKLLTTPLKQCNETYELFGIPQSHIRSLSTTFHDTCSQKVDGDKLVLDTSITKDSSCYACAFATYNAFRDDGSETMIFALKGEQDASCCVHEISLRNTDIQNILPLNCAGLLRSIRFSWDNTILISLWNDGTVSLLFKNGTEWNEDLSSFQTLHKSVSQISTSFDNKYLLCSGHDGTLHVYTLENTESSLSDHSESTSVSAREIFPSDSKREELSTTKDKSDASNVNSKGKSEVMNYTLQQEILSNLEEKLRRSADYKKTVIRKLINDLRKEYSELINLNNTLPAASQLTPDEIEVDGTYKKIASQEMEDKLNTIYEASLQKTQECEMRRKTIQDRYLNILEYEYFVVTGMSNHHKQQTVQSFPTRKLSQHLEHTIQKIEMRSALGQRDSVDNGSSLEYKHEDIDKVGKKDPRDLVAEKCVDGVENDAPFRSTYETRKVMRAQRMQSLLKTWNEKPNDDKDGSKDEMNLFSKSSLGIFLLKTSDEYQVPEDKQINSEIKLEEVVLLERALHSIKCNFNERLDTLRVKKCSLVQNTMIGSQKICSIDKKLSLLRKTLAFELNSGKKSSEISSMPKNPTSSHDVWKIFIEPSLQQNNIEFPENRKLFSEQDKHLYFKSLESCHSDFSQVQVPPTVTSVASMYYQKSNDDNEELQGDLCNETNNTNDWMDKFKKLLVNRFYLTDQSCNMQEDKIENDEIKKKFISSIEKDEIREQIIKFEYEKKKILNEIHEGVKNFDMLLYKLRKERFQIATEIKLGEMKFFTLLEEFEFLTTFDDKEVILRNKLEKCQNDKHEIDTTMKDSLKALATKKNFLDEWIANDKFNMDEFLSLAPASHPHYDYLYKVLFRKIKRSRTGSGNDDMDSDNESDDLEDEDFDESDEDDLDDDDDLDDTEEVCPLGCDETLYEKIILLREKRLDHEEALSGIKKQFEELKKIHERQMIKGKQYDKDLSSVISEIQTFQKEKQQLMNALKVIMPVKAANLFIWDEDRSTKGIDVNTKDLERLKPKAQTEMNDTLLISRKQLTKVRERIAKQREDIIFDKRLYIRLQKRKSVLEKEMVQIKESIVQGEEKCKELQLLKFGQLVDIEALDKVTVSTWEAEIEAKAKDINLAYKKKHEILNNECELFKEQLFQATKENTAALEEIAKFSERRIVIENYLGKDEESKNVNKNNDFIVRNESEMDISRLKILAKSQKQKIAAMKNEILCLKRKDSQVHVRV